MSTAQEPVNIKGLRAYGWRMGVECPKCAHRGVLAADDLLRGPNVSDTDALENAARRVRCAPCGTLGARWVILKSAAASKEWTCTVPF
ncbi:ribosomal protein S27E [Ancylobacter sp. 3268]|nr:ribosomal protein S27E [Ancylobacter sp. 3268]